MSELLLSIYWDNMFVSTNLPHPLGILPLVLLVTLGTPRKEAKSTKHLQNHSASGLKPGALPEQCHGPNTNSDTPHTPAPRGKEKELILIPVFLRDFCVSDSSVDTFCLFQNECPSVSPISSSQPWSCVLWLRTLVMAGHGNHSTRISGLCERS